ncbi:hypothetical protein CP061683_0886B, partial [Chlamydia psittaci 06-1683]
KSPFIYF